MVSAVDLQGISLKNCFHLQRMPSPDYKILPDSTSRFNAFQEYLARTVDHVFEPRSPEATKERHKVPRANFGFAVLRLWPASIALDGQLTLSLCDQCSPLFNAGLYHLSRGTA